MSPIPDTPGAFIDACRRCSRLERVWERWAELPFPDLEGRMREFEFLLRMATPEAARDRLSGEGWAWLPPALFGELAELDRRAALRPRAYAKHYTRGRR